MPETFADFIEARQPAWRELADLVGRARGRVERLGPDGVRQLGARYREAVADLALARRRFPAEAATAELDALVRDARPLVYSQVVERRSLAHFATTGYWQRVRERPAFLAVAAVALWVPMLAVGLWAHAQPDQGRQLAGISPLTQGIAEGGTRDPDTDKVTEPAANAAFSSQIFTNNARVALVAYAGGLTGGVLTLVSLTFNGIVVGLVAGLAVEGGFGDALWRLIVPHGVLELSLITVAGAAGLRTGWAILRPGHRTRLDALAVEGRAGVELALGSAFLLVPCGLVEGFVTPRGLSLAAALTVGLALGAWFWAMVLWRGRPDPVRAEPAP